MRPKWTGAWLVVVAFVMALLPMAANAATLAPPTLLTPSSGATVDQPLFSWSPVVGAGRYEIEVALDDQFVTVTDPGDEVSPRSVLGTTYIPRFSYTAKALYWHVRSVAADGTQSDWSQPREFTRRWTNDDEATGVEQGIPTPSSRVENVQLVGGGSSPVVNQIAVEWDPVPGASHYQVQIAPNDWFNQPLTGECRTPHTFLTPYIGGTYLRRTPIGGLACDPIPEFRAGVEYFVRVRAVDVPTTMDYPGGEDETTLMVLGLWSDQRDGSGDPAPGPLSFTPGPKGGSTPAGHAAQPTSPSTTTADIPLMAWEPSTVADSYKVVIAVDRDFTNRVGTYGTYGAYLMPAETYDDSLAGRSYYWFALPCTGTEPLQDCDTADRTAVNDDAYVGTFRKTSVPVGQLAASSADEGANVRLTWQEALTAVQLVDPSDSPGGVASYEIQVTTGTWAQAKPPVFTDNLAYSTAVSPLTPGDYRWRARPLDGQGVPLAWAYGPDFTIVGTDQPSPSPSQSTPGTTPTPGASETQGPTPVYQAPVPDQGTAAAIAPDKPGKPTVKRATKRKLRVRWRASEELGEPVTAYLVYRSTNGSTFKKARTTTSQTARLKSKRGRTYWFYVVADSDAGRSEASSTTKFRMPRR